MLIPGLVAFGVTLAISPVVLIGLRRLGVMDIPSDRSSHLQPTPRGGGVAFGIGAVTALLMASSAPGPSWMGILFAACAFGLVGLLDDLMDVPALLRLSFQVVTAAGVVVWVVPSSGGPAIASVGLGCLVTLWLVSYVNAFNFMDGIDGISVAQVVAAGVTWCAIAEVRNIPMLGIVSVTVVGAALGFAPYNFPRARMFLGDAGSYFIGAWLAAVTVLGLKAGVPPEAMLAPLTLYLADTGTTLLRRVWRGHLWYAPHRDHAYQRLVVRGWSHGSTTLLVAVLLAAVSALGLCSLTSSLALRVAGDVLATALIVGYLSTPRLLALHELRQMPGASSRPRSRWRLRGVERWQPGTARLLPFDEPGNGEGTSIGGS